MTRLSLGLIALALSVSSFGCKRYPPIDQALLARLLPGQRISLERQGALGEVWTCGTLPPSSLDVREVEHEGKTARAVVDVRSAGGDASRPTILTDGRLRISLEWIADAWTVMRIENISFRADRTACAAYLPAGFLPARWPSAPDPTLLGALFPGYDAARGRVAVGPPVPTDPRSGGADLCRGGRVAVQRDGQLAVVHRQGLADGRIALFVRTKASDEDCLQGCRDEGVVAIVSRHAQAATVDSLGPWHSSLRAEPLFEEARVAERSIFIEPCPTDGLNGPDGDGRCVWVEDHGELVNTGSVQMNERHDLSCDPPVDDMGDPATPPPWRRTVRSTLSFVGAEIVARDQVTWERGTCGDQSGPAPAPVLRSLERRYTLDGRRLQEVGNHDDPPPSGR